MPFSVSFPSAFIFLVEDEDTQNYILRRHYFVKRVIALLYSYSGFSSGVKSDATLPSFCLAYIVCTVVPPRTIAGHIISYFKLIFIPMDGWREKYSTQMLFPHPHFMARCLIKCAPDQN